MKVYVLTKDGVVYGAFPSLEAAKAKVITIVTSNWTGDYGEAELSVYRANYTITEQSLEEE